MKKGLYWHFILLLLAASFGIPLGCGGGEARSEMKSPDKVIADYRSARMQAREELLKQAYKQYGIEAGKEEVEARVREQLKRVHGREIYTQADAEAGNRRISALQELMSLWRTDAAKAEALYKSKYSSLIDAAEWEQLKKVYSVEKSFQTLMKAPQVTAEGLLDGERKIVEFSIKQKKLERTLKDRKVISEESRLDRWIDDQPQIRKLDECYQDYLASHPELARHLIPQPKQESAATSASGPGRPAPTGSGPKAASIPEYAAPEAERKQP